jgi:hypothetical protein
MKLRPLVIVAIIGLLWLTGCATVTFKRGAGPGAMAADEDACRHTSADETAYTQCLRDRGWFVAGKAAHGDTETVLEPPEPAPASAPPATVVPGASEKPVAVERPTPATADGPPATKPAVATPTNRAATTGTSAPVVPPAAPARPDIRSAAPEPAPAATPKVLDPLSKVDVGSWWKLGGTTADLDHAIAACVTDLGEAHRPNPGATLVTVALRDCLRKAKWFPVGHTVGH